LAEAHSIRDFSCTRPVRIRNAIRLVLREACGSHLRSETNESDLKHQLREVFRILANGSEGRLEFSCTNETYLLKHEEVIGRSVELYLKLSEKIPRMEFYYLFLEEVFPRVKSIVQPDAFRRAISIIDRAGVNELERSGRAILSPKVIEEWSAHVSKYYMSLVS